MYKQIHKHTTRIYTHYAVVTGCVSQQSPFFYLANTQAFIGGVLSVHVRYYGEDLTKLSLTHSTRYIPKV